MESHLYWSNLSFKMPFYAVKIIYWIFIYPNMEHLLFFLVLRCKLPNLYTMLNVQHCLSGMTHIFASFSKAREMSDEAGLPGGRWKVTPEWQVCRWWGGSWTTWTVISKTPLSIRSPSLLEDRMLRRTGPDSHQYLTWPCVMRVSPPRLCWGHISLTEVFCFSPRAGSRPQQAQK